MAKKTPVNICVNFEKDDDYKKEEHIAYVEGELFVWQTPKGWMVGHVSTGLGVCGKIRWKQKQEALAFLQKLLDYEPKINWDLGDLQSEQAIEKFFEINGKDFLQRAFEACK